MTHRQHDGGSRRSRDSISSSQTGSTSGALQDGEDEGNCASMSQNGVSTGSARRFLQTRRSPDEVKHSPSRRRPRQSQGVRRSREGQQGPGGSGKGCFKYSDYRLVESAILVMVLQRNILKVPFIDTTLL